MFAARRLAGRSAAKAVAPSSLNTGLPIIIGLRFASTDVTADGKPLFKSLLVANRGEIACRIFRTCKKLGIETIAVYSEADANSQHVKLADKAVCIGPAPALQSYLIPERILEACKLTGAQAVHPGYGFLSENSAFCKLLEDNGVTFVGPKAATIKEMGDKIRSKMIAEKAGVKHIPGFVGEVKDEEHLIKIANEIGYPVMVKAAHGGGGKGMRRANNDQECREGYRLSLAEARTAFNSSTMLVEKFIEDPRHIEFQVLADAHGNAVYVFERECSVQRRNQKLVEEAPSTFLTEEQRQRIGAEAVALAKVSHYQNAGTVEFLMGKDGQHYYLEMNTRLQVEHPISEMISGLDLVEQQIRIAAGLPLTLKQEDLKINGWAVEARVCAEDPVQGFLPSVGQLTKYIPPTREARVDGGFIEGDTISIHYDSLLAKVITHAPTRDEALALQKQALDSMVIRGINHNIAFLREVMEHPKFVAGKLTTNFIQDNFPRGFEGHTLSMEEKVMLVAAARLVFAGYHWEQVREPESWHSLVTEQSYTECELDDSGVKHVPTRITEILPKNNSGTGGFVVGIEAEIDGKKRDIFCASSFKRSEPVFTVEVDQDKRYTLQVVDIADGGSRITISYMGTIFNFNLYSEREYKVLKYMPEPEKVDHSKVILSPMPGSVYRIAVEAGDKVAAGQELIVLESMKSQTALRASKPGTVKEVKVKQGDIVSADQLLITLDD